MNTSTPERRALAVPSSRLARFTKLGSMTAGVAGNMVLNGAGQVARGNRPSWHNLLMTPRNITRIADQLAEMRGAAMKVGQLVSMDTGEMLPPELAQIMARLRSDAHFMPPAQLKQVFNTHWPKGWLRQFKTFSVRPIASASIGQVHRATTKDGRELAIKVQYPGVARSIDSDVSNVGALIKMSGLLPKGFDLNPYLEEARKQLHDETDYLLEGSYLSEFQSLLHEDARFRVPSLQTDWTTQNILAMEFAEGVPIEDAQSAPQETRDAIATSLIELMFKELFEFRLMQTDPNFANYRYDAGLGKIILLDFGATRRISPHISKQYKRLMQAGLLQDEKTMRAVSIDIGFFAQDTQKQHQNAILDMMSTVFSAMRATDTFDFGDTRLSQELQNKGMMLANDGFVPPPLPIDVLFVQRKFGGVFLLATQLKARVNLSRILTGYLSNA